MIILIVGIILGIIAGFLYNQYYNLPVEAVLVGFLIFIAAEAFLRGLFRQPFMHFWRSNESFIEMAHKELAKTGAGTPKKEAKKEKKGKKK